jgi:DNA-binding IclR family transcriptional regulator
MGIKALETALNVLELFSAARPELGVTEISAATGLDKSHVSKILREFCRNRILKQDPISRRYRVGPRALNLGAGYLTGWDIGRCGSDTIKNLVEETGCTATLNVIDGGSVLFVASQRGKTTRPLNLPVGSYLPLHATAAGKVSAAFSVKDELAKLLSRAQLPVITPTSIRNPDMLRGQLAVIRRDGFAATRGESTPGLAGLAVPVVGYNSDYLGALSLLFSIDDADQRREHQFVQLLWGAASRLSYRLGADDYPYAHS